MQWSKISGVVTGVVIISLVFAQLSSLLEGKKDNRLKSSLSNRANGVFMKACLVNRKEVVRKKKKKGLKAR